MDQFTTKLLSMQKKNVWREGQRIPLTPAFVAWPTFIIFSASETGMVTVFAFEILNSSCHVGPYGGPSRDVDPKRGCLMIGKVARRRPERLPGPFTAPASLGFPLGIGDWWWAVLISTLDGWWWVVSDAFWWFLMVFSCTVQEIWLALLLIVQETCTTWQEKI